MAWYPHAIREPVNRFKTPMPRPDRIGKHTAVSNALTLLPYFGQWGNPCSHFYIRESGVVVQHIDTRYRAAADLQGNPGTISIESWDGYPHNAPGYWSHNGDVPPWNAAQVKSLIRLVAWILKTHPSIPARLAVDSRPGASSRGVSWHRLGVNPWRVGGGLLYSNARGKACPGDKRVGQIPGILAKTEGAPPMKGSQVAYFVSPAEGRVSGNWGWRTHPITGARGNFHRGIDIAGPIGTPIRAAYGGTVRAISRSQNKSGNRITGTWNSGRYVVIDGPGGGSEWYGHLDKIKVKPGQRVKAGQVIATMGNSGNVTGPHLHLELWNSRNQGGGANGAGNTRDPRIDFRKYKVTPGAAFKGKPARPTKPKPPKRKPGYSKVVYNRQVTFARLGYYRGALDGIDGPYYKRGVKAWQEAQRYAPGLKADGVYGPASKAHWAFTKRLQRAMNKWKGRKIPVDGDLGGNTLERVGEVQARNSGRSGRYRGALDSIPGKVFCRMIGIAPHPGA